MRNVRMTICMTVVFIVMGLCSSVTNASLLAHYEFEGDANDSAGSSHGTLTNGASTVFDATINSQVLSLDGLDDHVYVGDQDILDFDADDSFSISAWIKTSQTSNAPIVDKRRWVPDGGFGYYKEGYTLIINQNKLYFGIEDSSNNGTSIVGNTVVNDNQWHHVVAVRDTTIDGLLLYVDGVLDAAVVSDATVGSLANSWDLLIGKWKSADGIVDHFYFDGSIDDVRIYSEAIPEPCTLLLLGLGGLVLKRKK